VSVYVILCQFMSIYASLGHLMSVYAILFHLMSVYVNLCQFISYYVRCQVIPVCFTSCHLYQLMSIEVSLSVSSALPFLSAVPHHYNHSRPSFFSLLIATHSAHTVRPISNFALQVLFSVCCFIMTVMLVPLDHNIFCVSLYRTAIKNSNIKTRFN